MTQAQNKKKQLIKVAVICVGIVAAAGGAYYGAGLFEDHLTAERNDAQTKVSSATSENTALKDRISKSDESHGSYEKITRNNPTGDFSLNRKGAYKLILELSKKYQIADTKLSISPIKELATDMGSKKGGKVIYSEVKVNFTAPTDTIAFGYLNALTEQLPGLVAYESVKLVRKAELTTSVFDELGSQHLPGLVTGEVVFNWLGLKPPEKTDGKSGAPGAPGAPPSPPAPGAGPMGAPPANAESPGAEGITP